jgi:hypothetical protein
MLFIDTSAFISVANHRDTHHKGAVDFLEEVRAGKTEFRRLLTTDYIIDETLTNIRFKMGHREAVEWGRAILGSHVVEKVQVDDKLLSRAFEIFEKYQDKRLSFTDCTSFAVMEALGIRKAFAFDSHFLALGFGMVP